MFNVLKGDFFFCENMLFDHNKEIQISLVIKAKLDRFSSGLFDSCLLIPQCNIALHLCEGMTPAHCPVSHSELSHGGGVGIIIKRKGHVRRQKNKHPLKKTKQNCQKIPKSNKL